MKRCGIAYAYKFEPGDDGAIVVMTVHDRISLADLIEILAHDLHFAGETPLAPISVRREG